MDARATIRRLLIALGLLAATAVAAAPAHAAGPGRFTPRLGRDATCYACHLTHMPELLAARYNWDGYREVDVFGHNFTPDTIVQFVITDAATGEQVASSLGWAGDGGYLTSFPGSGYPVENGTPVFTIPTDACGGVGRAGVYIQAYDPASGQWSNQLFYNAACL
jgi:hypothetical protein